jgi:hypothetical protein
VHVRSAGHIINHRTTHVIVHSCSCTTSTHTHSHTNQHTRTNTHQQSRWERGVTLMTSERPDGPRASTPHVLLAEVSLERRGFRCCSALYSPGPFTDYWRFSVAALTSEDTLRQAPAVAALLNASGHEESHRGPCQQAEATFRGTPENVGRQGRRQASG